MKGKTKVIVKKKYIADIGNYNVGDTGYIDGYISKGSFTCAIVVFENGSIENVPIGNLEALEEL